MKHIIRLCLATLVGTYSVALADEDVDDLYGEGSGAEMFALERFSDESVLLEINREARVNCISDGLCTLTAITRNRNEFTVSFSASRGPQDSGGGYGGGYGSGYGGGYGGGRNDSVSDDEVLTVNIQYTHATCIQKILVRRKLFETINRYMYGLINRDGSVRRRFTPADEAMLLFYEMILSKASGCSQNATVPN